MGNKFMPEAERVFNYFKEICKIPRGSGNMEAISNYCMKFAEENGLKSIRDDSKNVVIYKPGTVGLENADPVILQGHIDMICQKTEDSPVDPETEGLELYEDGDFLKARGTTLGADNGIAVAMIMTVLSSNNISHPPIEAVFTTDEEIGMLGAAALDLKLLKGRKMINLDAEEAGILTVACAGGSDFRISLPAPKTSVRGTKLLFEIKGLKGGHSGVDIDKLRVNANILAGRILDYANKKSPFDIIKINGGNKGNAIPCGCKAELVTKTPAELIRLMNDYAAVIKKEISVNEEGFSLSVIAESEGEYEVLFPDSRDKLIYMLLITPNGIIDMSAEIEGLVETSLNLGILATENEEIVMHYALRSSKKSALDFIEDKLASFASYHGCEYGIFGRYEPWEFNDKSYLQKLYVDTYTEKFGEVPKVAAIHAGLECAVFASKIDDLDCVAMGPDMFDVHTVNERLSISSAKETFCLLCDILGKCK